MKPTVFIVDDDEASAQSIRWLVESVDLSAEVYLNPAAFIQSYDPEKPGCVVLDVRMPGMSGLEVQEQLKERGADLPIIFVSGHGDIPIAVTAIKGGAIDFLEKPFRQQELIDLIHAAIEHDARRRDADMERHETLRRTESLTLREREILDLIVAGNLNKTIAAKLGLSTKTVEVHRSALMKKLGARCAPDLIRMGLKLSTSKPETKR
ncbi:MAG: response regulator transcription factor [Pseudomonadota bacterium]